MTLYQSIIKLIAKAIFRKPEFVYEEPLPDDDEPVVFTANHSAADGPVITTLYFPKPCRPWSISQILDKRTAAGFIFYDFFAGAVKKGKFFWRCLSHLLACLLRPILQAANGIPVYHDKRIVQTFTESVEALEKGTNIVVFPECPEKFTDHINDFYGGFAKLGELYYNRTGKKLKFYPTYVARSLKKVMVGKPVEYDPSVNGTVQRKQIAVILRDRTEALAASLPKHKVTPFLTKEWYTAYGHFWEEKRMYDYWNLSQADYNRKNKKKAKKERKLAEKSVENRAENDAADMVAKPDNE